MRKLTKNETTEGGKHQDSAFLILYKENRESDLCFSYSINPYSLWTSFFRSAFFLKGLSSFVGDISDINTKAINADEKREINWVSFSFFPFPIFSFTAEMDLSEKKEEKEREGKG